MITFEDGLQIELIDENATKAFASSLSKELEPGTTIYLHGDLGAGKTTLVRFMLSSLGHTGISKSPTFTIVEEYDVANLHIYHFDLYRLASPQELDFIGIRDYDTEKAVCIFEWADKGLGNIPEADLEITMDFKDRGRSVRLMPNTDTGLAILQAMTLGT